MGRYPELQKGVWYLVGHDGLDREGRCWLVAYGLRVRVEARYFDFSTGARAR